jgi:transposase InsO family protein
MSDASVVEREQAVQRFRAGESATAICRSLGRSREWLYKWVTRCEVGGTDWAEDGSRRPHNLAGRTAIEIETAIVTARRSLAQRGLFCGAQAIAWELDALGIKPIPAVRTINRILERHALPTRRAGPYVAKGTPYPKFVADRPSARHQTDFVGPCYLAGPVRFYSLHTVDLATGRCAVEPVLGRSSQITVDAVWAMWRRLGIPQHQQIDNDMVFYGSRTYPRGMGPLIRLCLAHQVEPWFIPPAEPWRNGVVERFNACWQQHGPLRQPVRNFRALQHASLAFEARHNGCHRYSKLGGKTPDAALAAANVRLRFPRSDIAPRHPLPKPDHGRYHVIRFVRRQGCFDVFGETFRVPAVAIHAYVRATVDVTRQRLLVYLDDRQIDEHPYQLR